MGIAINYNFKIFLYRQQDSIKVEISKYNL